MRKQGKGLCEKLKELLFCGNGFCGDWLGFGFRFAKGVGFVVTFLGFRRFRYVQNAFIDQIGPVQFLVFGLIEGAIFQTTSHGATAEPYKVTFSAQEALVFVDGAVAGPFVEEVVVGDGIDLLGFVWERTLFEFYL